jgi:hypothetical protein
MQEVEQRMKQLPGPKNRPIAGYVAIFTMQKMDQKTSKLGIFFAGIRLNLLSA